MLHFIQRSPVLATVMGAAAWHHAWAEDIWREVVSLETGLCVGGHVTGQVVALPERLLADGTPEFVLPVQPGPLVCGQRPLVVGPHVVHQVGSHVEGDAAFGTPVLGWEADGREGRQRVEVGRAGGLSEAQGRCQGSGPNPGAEEQRALLVHRGLEQNGALEFGGGEGQLGGAGSGESHHHGVMGLGERTGWLDEGTLPHLRSRADGVLRGAGIAAR